MTDKTVDSYSAPLTPEQAQAYLDSFTEVITLYRDGKYWTEDSDCPVCVVTELYFKTVKEQGVNCRACVYNRFIECKSNGYSFLHCGSVGTPLPVNVVDLLLTNPNKFKAITVNRANWLEQHILPKLKEIVDAGRTAGQDSLAL